MVRTYPSQLPPLFPTTSRWSPCPNTSQQPELWSCRHQHCFPLLLRQYVSRARHRRSSISWLAPCSSDWETYYLRLGTYGRSLDKVGPPNSTTPKLLVRDPYTGVENIQSCLRWLFVVGNPGIMMGDTPKAPGDSRDLVSAACDLGHRGLTLDIAILVDSLDLLFLLALLVDRPWMLIGALRRGVLESCPKLANHIPRGMHLSRLDRLHRSAQPLGIPSRSDFSR